jgi:hypothetical protein
VASHEELEKGKLVSEWTPVKYDGRYEISAKDTVLKLRTGGSLHSSIQNNQTAVALVMKKKKGDDYFEFDDGLLF